MNDRFEPHLVFLAKVSGGLDFSTTHLCPAIVEMLDQDIPYEGLLEGGAITSKSEIPQSNRDRRHSNLHPNCT